MEHQTSIKAIVFFHNRSSNSTLLPTSDACRKSFLPFCSRAISFQRKKKTDKNSLHTFKRVLRLLFELLLIYIYFFRLLSGRLRRVSNEILPRNSFPENPSARCNCIRPSFHFHPVTERILRGEQSSKVSGRRRRARSDRITAADERQRE